MSTTKAKETTMTAISRDAADKYLDVQDITTRPGEKPACTLRNSQIVSLTRQALQAFALTKVQAAALASSVGYENVGLLVDDLLAERTRCEESLPDDHSCEEYRLYRVRGQFCDRLTRHASHPHQPTRNPMTITIPAHLLEDHDFCHRAAVDAVATALGVSPVLLSASWTTEEREEISVELPDSTGLDVLERLGVVAAIRALPREPYSEASE